MMIYYLYPHQISNWELICEIKRCPYNRIVAIAPIPRELVKIAGAATAR
jgi:hypothetical protein